nr:CBN-CAT-2 protein [Haemonchus contortus]
MATKTLKGDGETNHPRRFSLAHQASCETLLHADVKRQTTLKHREQLKKTTKGEKRNSHKPFGDEGRKVRTRLGLIGRLRCHQGAADRSCYRSRPEPRQSHWNRSLSEG